MITRISNVIRPKGSDLIFDHPYDAAEYVRTAPHETAHRSAAQIIRSSTLLVSVNGECDFVVARSYGARLVSRSRDHAIAESALRRRVPDRLCGAV